MLEVGDTCVAGLKLRKWDGLSTATQISTETVIGKCGSGLYFSRTPRLMSPWAALAGWLDVGDKGTRAFSLPPQAVHVNIRFAPHPFPTTTTSQSSTARRQESDSKVSALRVQQLSPTPGRAVVPVLFQLRRTKQHKSLRLHPRSGSS